MSIANLPSERIFYVETAGLTPEGELVPIPGAAEDFLKKMAGVLELVGGTFVISAERNRVFELEGMGEVHITYGLVGRWQSFAPKRREAPSAPEPEAADEAADDEIKE
jgi:hypothetical protein